MDWKAFVLADGRVRVDVQIDGQVLPIILDGPPGTVRMKNVNIALEAYLAERELKQLLQRQKQAEAILRHLDETTPVSPPFLAEFFISFLAPKTSGQAFLGDLEEMFHKNAERYGAKQARRKYWMEVARSFAPLVLQWLKRIGFFTILIDYFRSKFGL
jgi:hypothetical protein